MLRGLQEYDQLKNTIWHAQLSFSKMKYNKEKIAYYFKIVLGHAEFSKDRDIRSWVGLRQFKNRKSCSLPELLTQTWPLESHIIQALITTSLLYLDWLTPQLE